MKKWTLLALCLLSVPVSAGLYRVEHVPVEVEAQNAVTAKDTALKEAVQKSFPLLLDKVVLGGDISSITPTPEQIDSWVESVSVSNEKNTTTKYIADVHVQYKESEVQKYLSEMNIPFLTKEPDPMIVVPIYKNQNQTMVFHSENPVWVALQQKKLPLGLHPLVIPTGDEYDQQLIVSDVTEKGQYESLQGLMDKYYVPGALIMEVSKNEAVYMVKIIGYPDNVSFGTDLMFAVSSVSQNLVGVMDQIIDRAMLYMERKYKAYQSYRGLSQGEIVAVFQVKSLTEWVAVSKQLEKMTFLETIDIQAVYDRKIYVRLTFSDTVSGILEKMTQSGFYLIPEGNVYVWQKQMQGLSEGIKNDNQ